jgi:hypothetical protein
MWNDISNLSCISTYLLKRSVSFAIGHREHLTDLTVRLTGNQYDPKSIIEWTDVEDETKKLDSYSLLVSRLSKYRVFDNDSLSWSSPSALILPVSPPNTRKSRGNGNWLSRVTFSDG